MRRGAAISGAMHLGLIALALYGADWFRDREPVPLDLTEIEMVDGAELDARLSTAPVVQSDGPAELSPPSPGDSAPASAEPPDAAAEPTVTAALDLAPPPEPRPDEPKIIIPPPPTDIPSEAPAPSIAEIPSPDPLDQQAAEPESPASTEPVQPLASIRPPTPSPRPLPPPEAEPEAERTQEPAEATVPQPTAEQPKPEPAPAEETEPEAVAELQPDAPESLAPREAKLPVAKPAEIARAARAASRQEPPPQQAQAEPEKPKPQPAEQRVAEAEPKAAQPAGGSTRPTAPLNEGEKNALRLGIKNYYTYSGRQDPSLRVTIRVRLTEQAEIDGKPELLRAEGGDQSAQNALYQAGRRALLQAQSAGEFNKLPQEKYAAWQVLNVVFTTEKGIDFSS